MQVTCVRHGSCLGSPTVASWASLPRRLHSRGVGTVDSCVRESKIRRPRPSRTPREGFSWARPSLSTACFGCWASDGKTQMCRNCGNFGRVLRWRRSSWRWQSDSASPQATGLRAVEATMPGGRWRRILLGVVSAIRPRPWQSPWDIATTAASGKRSVASEHGTAALQRTVKRLEQKLLNALMPA